jgi:hypothetical protein
MYPRSSISLYTDIDYNCPYSDRPFKLVLNPLIASLWQGLFKAYIGPAIPLFILISACLLVSPRARVTRVGSCAAVTQWMSLVARGLAFSH